MFTKWIFFAEGNIRKEGITFLDISKEINNAFYDTLSKITCFRTIRIPFYVKSLLEFRELYIQKLLLFRIRKRSNIIKSTASFILRNCPDW